MSVRASKPTFLSTKRNVLIASAVLVFHGLALWALQTGLLQRAVAVVVPVEVLAQMVDLPKPKVTPARKPPDPVQQVVSKPQPTTQVAPTLLAVENATLTPNAPAVQAIAAAAPYVTAVPVTSVATPALPAPPAAPKVVLPSSDADYLSNPKPPYPPMSKRLNEQGKVVVRVLISSTGQALKAELKQSSTYDRLDQAALAIVMKWRYVPGKRNGVAEEMSYDVPIIFKLE